MRRPDRGVGRAPGGCLHRPPTRHSGVSSMAQPATISADYTHLPSEVAASLALLVEARQPAMVRKPSSLAKSMIAQQIAADGGCEYVDIGRSCSTPWTFAASLGATPPTAPAGRRRCSCRRRTTPVSGSSTSKNCLCACRWYKRRSINSRSNARLANANSPRAHRLSPTATE